MFENERIYIAGPECFYEHGPEILAAMRKMAESYGFGVTLPNDHPLDMSGKDLKDHAKSIFQDLEQVMMDTTIIIADLEAYRGSEADSGTVFEIGMAYAKKARCYGYTRDKRSLACKDQKYTLRDGKVWDEHGKEAPYKELPFAPCVVGSTKIVEGGFLDCLKVVMVDLEEESRLKGMSGGSITKEKEEEPEEVHLRPRVYLSGPERYDEGAEEIYQKMAHICDAYDLEAITPITWEKGVTKIDSGDAYTRAANQFQNYQQKVRSCDAIIANLNDYRGYECSNDVGFECGMAFQLGKKRYGYMDDTRYMKDRVPHLGSEKHYRDHTGSNVENFDYPLNLMFGCSMEIFEGSFESVIGEIAARIKGEMPD